MIPRIKTKILLIVALTNTLILSGAPITTGDKPDTNEVIKFNQQALNLAYSKPDSAMILAQHSLKLARDINYPHGEIRALIRIGIIYDVLSKDSMATESYIQSLSLAENANDTAGIASNLNNLGLIHWKQNQLLKALDYFNEAYEMFRIKNQNMNMASTSNNIGLIYGEMERHETALSWHRRALQDYSNVKEENRGAFEYDVYSNIGLIYQSLDIQDSARFYNHKAIEGFRKHKNFYGLAKALSNYGIMLNETNQADKAIGYFEEAMKLSLEIENLYSHVSSGFNLSTSYLYLKRYEKELEVLKEIYPFLAELNNNELGYKICFSIAKAYFRQGNFQEGNKYLKEYNAYYEAYFHEILDKNIIESEKKFEVQESKRKLAEAQTAELKAGLELKEKNYWLIVLSLFIAVSILATIIFFQKNKARQEKENARAILKERDKGLKAIIDAQEEERKRIAGELHEGVGNQLLALKMNLKTVIADDQKMGPGINKLLTDVIDEVRAVSHQMMPKVLQEFGCVPALNDMLERVFKHSGIIFRFETHKVSNKRYDSRIETVIYRVAQEAVNNIIKHSKATEVTIQLIETKKSIILLIEDNGTGIHAKNNNAGLGLTNMKSRVNTVNGEFNIESEYGKGTTITVRINIE